MGPFYILNVFLYLLSPQNFFNSTAKNVDVLLDWLVSVCGQMLSFLNSDICIFFSQDQCWFRQSGQTSSRNTRPHLRTTQFLTTSTIWMPRLQGEKSEHGDVLPPYQHITRSPGHCLCFSVGRRPSGTWPFLMAGLRGPCWRGSARSKLTFPFLSFMDHAQTSTVSLDMRLRKPDQMWKSG